MRKSLLKLTPKIFKRFAKKFLKFKKDFFLNFSNFEHISLQEIEEFVRRSDKFIFCYPKNDLRSFQRKSEGFEPDWLQRIWIEFLVYSDLIIDVGANLGEYSLPYVSEKKNAYLYEANPLLIPVLIKTISLNKKNKFLHLKNISVGDRVKLSKFITNKSNSGFSSTIFKDVFIRKNNQLIKTIVPQTTIDKDLQEKIESNKSIALKIDIEGTDFYALKGCLKTIKKVKNVFLLIEYGEYLKEEIFTKEEIETLSEFSWFATIDKGDFEVKKIEFNREFFTRKFYEKNFKYGVNLLALKGDKFLNSISRLTILN